MLIFLYFGKNVHNGDHLCTTIVFKIIFSLEFLIIFTHFFLTFVIRLISPQIPFMSKCSVDFLGPPTATLS